jgi:hypothetical protein
MKALEPFSNVKHVDLNDSQYQKERHPTTIKDVEDHECSKDILTSVGNFFSSLGTVEGLRYSNYDDPEEFGKMVTQIMSNLSMESHCYKKSSCNIAMAHEQNTRMVLSCLCLWVEFY